MKSSAPTFPRVDLFRRRLDVIGWLGRLAGARSTGRTRAYPGIDARTVIYAIGDIHGRADLLRGVHRRIDADWRLNPAERRLEVYLGDYLDRGPDSAPVITLLRERARMHRIMPLMGNHEAMLLHFLEGRVADRDWLDCGGRATALSYGVNPSLEPVLGAALARAVPLEHMQFLRALQPCFRYGPYFFAHAGVSPDRPLEEQTADDLLWIRKPFLEHRRPFGAIVVHGHTPMDEPEFRPNRINLDTGAYATGRLTCLRIDASGASLVGWQEGAKPDR